MTINKKFANNIIMDDELQEQLFKAVESKNFAKVEELVARKMEEHKNSNFNDLQLRQLKLAKEEGLDTSSFEKPCYSHLKMREFRLLLKKGVDITPCLDPSASLRKIRNAGSR